MICNCGNLSLVSTFSYNFIVNKPDKSMEHIPEVRGRAAGINLGHLMLTRVYAALKTTENLTAALTNCQILQPAHQ